MASSASQTEPTHYQFIGNETTLRLFYRCHIAPFQEHPQANRLAFKLMLIARRKYHPTLSIGQRMIDRKVIPVTRTEDQFVRDVQKYCVPIGTYVDDRDRAAQEAGEPEKPLPLEALAIYMTADPCDTMKAYFKTEQEIGARLEEHLVYTQKMETYAEQLKKKLKELVDGASTSSPNDDQEKQLKKPEAPPRVRFESVYKTQVQKSALSTYRKLDVDTKEPAKLALLLQFFQKHQITPHLITETRGGYHILIDNRTGIQGPAHQALHQFVSHADQKEWVTAEKRALLAIPGTYQGGFLVQLADLD